MAGALNSVAGGGSFITFPSLISAGVPSIEANATNTVALWPGTLASVSAYRNELATQRSILLPMCAVSILGGLLGALLLLNTPASTFDRLIPFLLLFATLIFTFSGAINRRLRGRSAVAAKPEDQLQLPRRMVVGTLFLQLLVATYGGFFGAGIGILMLALLGLMGMEDIHAMNALKTLLASCINGIAVIAFVLAGKVYWPQALLMVVGASLGGYFGAFYAKKVNPLYIRRFVIIVGFIMTAYFFIRRA